MKPNPFRPNDHVQCIDASWLVRGALTLGHTYRVVYKHLECVLLEDEHGGREWHFARRFRLIEPRPRSWNFKDTVAA